MTGTGAVSAGDEERREKAETDSEVKKSVGVTGAEEVKKSAAVAVVVREIRAELGREFFYI
jgi:hypothetical protein